MDGQDHKRLDETNDLIETVLKAWEENDWAGNELVVVTRSGKERVRILRGRFA